MSRESGGGFSAELEHIRLLKTGLETAHKAAVASGKQAEDDEADRLVKEITERTLALREQLNPFEALLHIREQYTSQVDMLESVGILQEFRDGKKGMTDIQGQEHQLPTLEDVNKRLLERRDVVKNKAEQGFKKMLLVPFGMSLDTLTEVYRKAIQKKFDAGTLFRTQKTPQREGEVVEAPERITSLHTKGPLWVWDKFNDADKKGTLVYHPKEFSENHEGQTKQELIQLNGGWSILLVEDMPNIPREGQAKTTGTRTQIDTSGTSIKKYMKTGQTIPSPMEYLAALNAESQKPPGESAYTKERGMTPEEWLILALTHLEETNEVIDDAYSGGHGSVSWLTGAYFPASEFVPFAFWYRDDGRAGLSGRDRGSRDGNCGGRSAVGV